MIKENLLNVSTNAAELNKSVFTLINELPIGAKIILIIVLLLVLYYALFLMPICDGCE